MAEDDPINFHQAMESSNSQKWIDAMNEEIKSMKDNDVWDLVPLLEGARPIGQKEGIDYKESFSPVSSQDLFRKIMA